MAEVLYRLNLSYTRPTYILNKADKEKQGIFKKDFESLKKHLNGEVDHILFEDESMIRDYQAIQKTWFIKGHQRKIPKIIFFESKNRYEQHLFLIYKVTLESYRG